SPFPQAGVPYSCLRPVGRPVPTRPRPAAGDRPGLPLHCPLCPASARAALYPRWLTTALLSCSSRDGVVGAQPRCGVSRGTPHTREAPRRAPRLAVDDVADSRRTRLWPLAYAFLLPCAPSLPV